MEIIDYLRILKKRLWILIGIPVLGAVGVAVVVLVVRPVQYAATATVAAPALVGGANNQYSGTNGLKAFVSNFESAATSNLILNPISAQTHIPKSTLMSGLSVTEVGTSDFMNVTYQTVDTNKARTASVARAVASKTLVYLFQAQVRIAQQPVTAAQRQLKAAQAAVAAYQAKIGMAEPDQRLKSLQSAISQLVQTQAVDQATGQSTTASNLGSALASLRAQETSLETKAATYNNLQSQVTNAQTVLNNVTPNLQAAQEQFNAANPAQAVTVGQTKRVSRASSLVKGGLIAVGAGLFLALALIALLEILGRTRPKKRAGAADRVPYRPEDRAGAVTDGSEPAVVVPRHRGDSAGRSPGLRVPGAGD